MRSDFDIRDQRRTRQTMHILIVFASTLSHGSSPRSGKHVCEWHEKHLQPPTPTGPQLKRLIRRRSRFSHLKRASDSSRRDSAGADAICGAKGASGGSARIQKGSVVSHKRLHESFEVKLSYNTRYRSGRDKSLLDVCDILRIPKVRRDAVQGVSHIDEVPANVDKGEAVGELAAVAGEHRVVPADHGGARREVVRMRSLDEGKEVDSRRIFLPIVKSMSARATPKSTPSQG
jgi:hypothetical protein